MPEPSTTAASSAASGWRDGLGLLRRPAYRRLIGGQIAGQGADGLAQIAFAQVVLFEVGEGATPGEITLLLAVTLLPFSIVGPIAGVFIDRLDRRRLMASVSVARAALVAASVSVLVLDSRPLAYASVLLLISASRFVLAAKGAALPRTVGNADLVTANAVSSIGGMSAAFVGAVGGSLVVAGAPAAGLLGAAGLYALAAALFARMPGVGGGAVVTPLPNALARVAHEVGEEVTVVARTPAIRRPLLAVLANRGLLGFGFILLVLVADDRYDLEAPGYGMAIAVTGVGAFLGTWLAPVLGARFRRSALLPLPFLVGALAALAGGAAPNLAVLVGAVGIAAFAFQVLKVLVDALLQEASPDVLRGRVFSAYDVLYNVAFILAGLAMVPLWSAGREAALLWGLAAAFVVLGAAVARSQRAWPFQGRGTASDRARGAATNGSGQGRRRWAGRLLALPAGAVLALAFPEADIPVVAAVGLVPLWVLVARSPSRREAIWRSWFGGAGFFTAVNHWLVPIVGPFAPVLALALGACWIPAGWVLWALLRGGPSPARLLGATAVVPSLFVLGEFVRSWEALGGPWGLLGAGVWDRPALLSLAWLGGIWLASWVLAAVNVAVTGLVLPGVPVGVRATGAATAVCLALAVVALDAVRTEPEVRDVRRVALVQPGHIPGPERRFDAHLTLTEDLVGDDVDLVVWAESSVGFDLPENPEEEAQVVDLAERIGAPLLVNVDARRGETGGIYKSSVLYRPEGPDDRYDKMRLVPFGEYIPLRFALGWLADVTDAAEEDRRRGEELTLMDVEDMAIGPLVCFESAFPDLTRHQVAAGSDLVVLQTATTTFQGSWAQAQHAALAAVRAAETGRPMVHAAVSGVSGAFDARGRELGWLHHDRTENLVVDVPVVEPVTTPYVRFGDWAVAASIAILLVAGLVQGLRAARPAPAPSPAPSPSEGGATRAHDARTADSSGDGEAGGKDAEGASLSPTRDRGART